MADTSSARSRWSTGTTQIRSLQTAIFSQLQTLSDDNLDSLNALVEEYDRLIRGLPFNELNAVDVSELQSELQQLKSDYQQLTDAVYLKRQGLLDQSSQSKKATRSARAYQQTQGY